MVKPCALRLCLRWRDKGNCAPLLLSKKSSRAALGIIEFPTDSKMENIFIKAVDMADFEDGKEGQIEASQVTHMFLRCSWRPNKFCVPIRFCMHWGPWGFAEWKVGQRKLCFPRCYQGEFVPTTRLHHLGLFLPHCSQCGLLGEVDDKSKRLLCWYFLKYCKLKVI